MRHSREISAHSIRSMLDRYRIVRHLRAGMRKTVDYITAFPKQRSIDRY